MDMATNYVTQTFYHWYWKIIDKKIHKLGIWQIFGSHDKLQHHLTATAKGKLI